MKVDHRTQRRRLGFELGAERAVADQVKVHRAGTGAGHGLDQRPEILVGHQSRHAQQSQRARRAIMRPGIGSRGADSLRIDALQAHHCACGVGAQRQQTIARLGTGADRPRRAAREDPVHQPLRCRYGASGGRSQLAEMHERSPVA